MTRPRLDIPALELGPDWFNQMFATIGIRAQVRALTARSIGTGQIGENVRFVFEYADADDSAPASLVGKFPSGSEASIMTARLLNHYQREVMFYRTFPAVAGMITPDALYTDYDPQTNRFALVMEDMAPAVQGDQLLGCGVQEARLALEAAAVLHAAHWQDPGLDAHGWLQGSSKAPPPALPPEAVAGLWGGFKERYQAHLTDDIVTVGDAFARALPAYAEQYQGPFALTHNDFRLDNMLFAPAGSRKPLAVVDWQTAGKGAPASDVAYFIGAGLTRAERPRHEKALLLHYHDCLTARGVSGYSLEDLYRDYRLFSFYGISVAFGAAMLVKQTERGDEMFLTMIRRHTAQVMDNEALELLPV